MSICDKLLPKQKRINKKIEDELEDIDKIGLKLIKDHATTLIFGYTPGIYPLSKNLPNLYKDDNLHPEVIMMYGFMIKFPQYQSEEINAIRNYYDSLMAEEFIKQGMPDYE